MAGDGHIPLFKRPSAPFIPATITTQAPLRSHARSHTHSGIETRPSTSAGLQSSERPLRAQGRAEQSREGHHYSAQGPSPYTGSKPVEAAEPWNDTYHSSQSRPTTSHGVLSHDSNEAYQAHYQQSAHKDFHLLTPEPKSRPHHPITAARLGTTLLVIDLQARTLRSQSMIQLLHLLLSARSSIISIQVLLHKQDTEHEQSWRLAAFSAAGLLRRQISVSTHAIPVMEPRASERAGLSNTINDLELDRPSSVVVLADEWTGDTTEPDRDDCLPFVEMTVSSLHSCMTNAIGIIHAIASEVATALRQDPEPIFAYHYGAFTYPAQNVCSGPSHGFMDDLTRLALKHVRKSLHAEAKVGSLSDLVPELEHTLPQVETSKYHERNDSAMRLDMSGLRLEDAGHDGWGAADGESPTKLWAEWALREEDDLEG